MVFWQQESLSWSCEERPAHSHAQGPLPWEGHICLPPVSTAPLSPSARGPQGQLVRWTTTTTKLFLICKVLRLISILSSQARFHVCTNQVWGVCKAFSNTNRMGRCQESSCSHTFPLCVSPTLRHSGSQATAALRLLCGFALDVFQTREIL